MFKRTIFVVYEAPSSAQSPVEGTAVALPNQPISRPTQLIRNGVGVSVCAFVSVLEAFSRLLLLQRRRIWLQRKLSQLMTHLNVFPTGCC